MLKVLPTDKEAPFPSIEYVQILIIRSQEVAETSIDKLDENVAAVMVTNPNTCGVFEKDILEISKWFLILFWMHNINV